MTERFVLPPVATILEISAIHRDLTALFRRGSLALAIDGSAMEEGDVSLLQVLLAAQQAARQGGRALSIIAPPGSPLAGLIRAGGCQTLLTIEPGR